MNEVVLTVIQAIGWAVGLAAAFAVFPYAIGMIGHASTSARRLQGLMLACAALLVVSGLAASSTNIQLGLVLLIPGLLVGLWLLRTEMRRRDTRYL